MCVARILNFLEYIVETTYKKGHSKYTHTTKGTFQIGSFNKGNQPEIKRDKQYDD